MLSISLDGWERGKKGDLIALVLALVNPPSHKGVLGVKW